MTSKYKPYPKYKDSGIQWIGEIPEEWEVRKTKHLLTNLDGKRIPISADMREEGDIPYYGATGVLDYVKDYLFNETLLLIGEDGAPFFDKTKNVAYIIKEKSWVNNHAHVLRVSKNVEVSWLCHYFNAIDYSRYIKGTTRDKLNQDELSNILVMTPSHQDQTSITNFLDKKIAKTDVLIERDKKLTELLKEKRAALINHTVTKGLPVRASRTQTGLDPNAKMKDSGIEWIGEIPEGWEIRKIKHLTENFDGKRIPISAEKRENGKIPYYGATGVLDYVKDFIFNEELLLVGEDGAPFFEPFKDVAYIIYGKSWVNNHAHILRVIGNNLIKWLCYYLNIYDYGAVIKGSTRDKLNQDQLSNMFVVKPSIKEQTTIVNFLDKATAKIDKTIKLIEKKIKLLEEYKKSLIHHTVTGKIDVREVKNEFNAKIFS